MADTVQPTSESIEQAIRLLGEGPPEQALPSLTAVANRAIIELHKVAREQARAKRGEADWGKWARLANAVRSGVLQVAAIRDSVKSLGLQPAPEAKAARAVGIAEVDADANHVPADSGGPL